MSDKNPEWYLHALHHIHHPVSLINTEQKFVWVNRSFEHLVGYSEAELLGKTWMDITEMSDVGGDLASVTSIINEERQSYTTAKRYKHKSGELVPVAITVWRFPLSGDLTGFSVEAVPENNMLKLEQIHKTHLLEIQALKLRLDNLERLHKGLDIAAKLLYKWIPIGVSIIGGLAWIYVEFIRKTN